MEIDPHNGGYDSTLANIHIYIYIYIYGELWKWDEVRKVRRIKMPIKPCPGCSWIQVNEQVFQFYSAETAQPRTEEIHGILESLLGFFSFKSS